MKILNGACDLFLSGQHPRPLRHSPSHTAAHLFHLWFHGLLWKSRGHTNSEVSSKWLGVISDFMGARARSGERDPSGPPGCPALQPRVLLAPGFDVGGESVHRDAVMLPLTVTYKRVCHIHWREMMSFISYHRYNAFSLTSRNPLFFVILQLLNRILSSCLFFSRLLFIYLSSVRCVLLSSHT